MLFGQSQKRAASFEKKSTHAHPINTIKRVWNLHLRSYPVLLTLI